MATAQAGELISPAGGVGPTALQKHRRNPGIKLSGQDNGSIKRLRTAHQADPSFVLRLSRLALSSPRAHRTSGKFRTLPRLVPRPSYLVFGRRSSVPFYAIHIHLRHALIHSDPPPSRDHPSSSDSHQQHLYQCACHLPPILDDNAPTARLLQRTIQRPRGESVSSATQPASSERYPTSGGVDKLKPARMPLSFDRVHGALYVSNYPARA